MGICENKPKINKTNVTPFSYKKEKEIIVWCLLRTNNILSCELENNLYKAEIKRCW